MVQSWKAMPPCISWTAMEKQECMDRTQASYTHEGCPPSASANGPTCQGLEGPTPTWRSRVICAMGQGRKPLVSATKSTEEDAGRVQKGCQRRRAGFLHFFIPPSLSLSLCLSVAPSLPPPRPAVVHIHVLYLGRRANSYTPAGVFVPVSSCSQMYVCVCISRRSMQIVWRCAHLSLQGYQIAAVVAGQLGHRRGCWHQKADG